MSWKDNLLDASFRGVRFDVKAIEDQVANATAEHAYAYMDGANVEDLGEEAGRISIRAIFWGEDYDQRLKDFLEVLRQPGNGELIHPVFGKRIVQRKSFSIEHDADLVDGCLLRMNFIESLPGQPLFAVTLVTSSADNAGDQAQNADDEASSLFDLDISDLTNSMPNLSAVNAFAERLNSRISGLINRIGYQANTVRAVLNTVELPLAWLTEMRSVFQSVTLPLQSLLDDDDSAGSSRAVTWNTAASTLKIATSTDASTTTTDSTVLSNYPVTPALARGEELASAMEKVIAATTAADVASDLLADEAINEPQLNPTEVETVANDVRELIQQAIDALQAAYPGDELYKPRPTVEALKQTAYSIQEAAITVINARPPLIQRPAPHAGSLALIAHTWYGDWTRGTELARLNPTIHLPNFIEVGQVLNAFAK